MDVERGKMVVEVHAGEPMVMALVRSLCGQMLPSQGIGRDPYDALTILNQAVIKSIFSLDPEGARSLIETQIECVEIGARIMRETGEEDGDSPFPSPETVRRITAEVEPKLAAAVSGFIQRARDTAAADFARKSGRLG